MAVDLAGRLPATRAALYAGEITAAKARAVWEATIPLDADAARRVLRDARDERGAVIRREREESGVSGV